MSAGISLNTAYAATTPQAAPSSHSTSEVELIPYAFATESLGITLGGIGLWKGAGQPQAAVFGTLLGSETSTWMALLAASNYVLSRDSRLLIGGQFYEADYKNFDFYLGKAASNSSTFDDSIKANSRESKHYLSFRYILPFGGAKTNPIYAALYPQRNLTGIFPWTSGVSSLEFRPMYQSRYLSSGLQHRPLSEFSQAEETWSLSGQYRWDNRNTTNNPNHGSLTELNVTTGVGDNDYPSWWRWDLSQSWYLDLGKWDGKIDQQVLAVNVYTSDTPSWNNTGDFNGKRQFKRPPEYAATSLGGLYRLRSYPSGRFVDRSAIFYSAEYRMNPSWQPLGNLPVFDWYNVPWWQWVVFAETGRVASSFNLTELHTDMKWSVGLGMRFQVEGIVVRTEMAWGGEGGLFRVMINQPF